jgi:hypothetical protein
MRMTSEETSGRLKMEQVNCDQTPWMLNDAKMDWLDE